MTVKELKYYLQEFPDENVIWIDATGPNGYVLDTADFCIGAGNTYSDIDAPKHNAVIIGVNYNA